ncbi:adenylyltransferase and sulfurtransferase MOCS3 [Planococcus citri]|uniref:adenylyltransferase and sulfurtransferase MOCS3 n=1 Tax=Planococcus citri TaxID=170843 RepID=UPI0031F93F2A
MDDLSSASTDIQRLRDEIGLLNEELREKKKLLALLEDEQKQRNNGALDTAEISRYSRQIILPSIGLKGQQRLKNASVLIVGVGGLGCPAALYLTSAGVGRIGLVDYDDVEINNLHRQILHSEDDLNVAKVESASDKLKRLNHGVKFENHKCQLTSENAIPIISQYDVILDATDNVATRYLLNDACIFAKKPLVSGSALQTEGQLTVYNHLSSPCYRCLYPQPPPPNTVNNCSSSGVLGPVCGVIGSLQALEAVKIILDLEDVLSGRMLLFDGYDTTFRCIKLRKKKLDCDVCGINPTIKHLIDYEEFCSSPANDKGKSLHLLNKNERISVNDLYKLRSEREPHLLIDVRSNVEYEMCHLPESINLHINSLDKHADFLIKKINDLKCITDDPKIIFICRRGNDSQIAVNMLKSKLDIKSLYDVEGGFHAWSKHIDQNFPHY